METPPLTLRVEFDTADAFRREFEANIASGGLFVPRDEPLPLRAMVRVELVLLWADERVELDAEVVHCVPPELAASGARPGVAVQFQAAGTELQTMLARHLDAVAPAAPARRPADPRRRVARAPARVKACVEARGGRVEARTRDISPLGVLISVPTDEIDVGEVVRVSIEHPRTGEELEVEGRVVRCIERDGGGVAAVGIEFAAGDERSSDVEGFVTEVASAEHSRRLGGISGPISELGLAHLLKMFASAAPQGTLTVMRGGEEGYLGFEAGLLLGVRLGPTRGIKALARMLSWPEGRFEFHARVDADAFDDGPEPLAGALLQATRMLEESRRGAAPALPPQAVPRLDEAALAGASLDKVESSVVDLARVGMSVRKIVDVVPEPDPVVRTALAALVERGILSFE